MEGQTLMIIIGGTDTGKIILVKLVTKIVNETVQNITPVIRLGTTKTAAFLISGDTCHSVLSLPVNISFQDLKGVKPKFLQYHLDEIILIIIDEILIMGNKMLYQIDK